MLTQQIDNTPFFLCVSGQSQKMAKPFINFALDFYFSLITWTSLNRSNSTVLNQPTCIPDSKTVSRHTNWNVHFKWLLSSVYWNLNASLNQTLLPLLHNTALLGYKNSSIEYMPTCAKKWLPAFTLLYCHTTHKEGEEREIKPVQLP